MNLNLINLIVLFLIEFGYGDRTKDRMYEHFDGKASCFRRLNATHQIGCSSKLGGSIGVIHYVERKEDLDFILKHGNAGDYMPIIPTFLLTPNTISNLKSSKKVSGLLVYNQTETFVDHYSHELSCPNANFNDKTTCATKWNKEGTGILHQDLPFPVYYVDNDDDLNKLKDCFHKFNNFSYDTQYTRSLCFIELDSFMYAAKDTPTCIRRSNIVTNLNPVKVCDPLGGENVWASLYPIDNNTRSDSYIIVAAHLDTTSMFNALYTGAVNPVTSIVTLLATADLLKRFISNTNTETYNKNVLFVLFNGESYDYIGSQRMVYDMENDAFPMKFNSEIKNSMPLIHLNDISMFVELSQLTRSTEVYVHRTKASSSEVNQFVKSLSNYEGDLKVKIVPDTFPLPPGSIQSFVRSHLNFTGLMLADYKEEYTNKYYNSLYDNITNLDYQYYNVTEDLSAVIPSDSIQSRTQNISLMLAKALYVEITGNDYSGTEKPQISLIDELYNCYLLDADCKIHQAVQRRKLKETPHNSYSLYVGVTVVPNLFTYVVGLTLGWLTGDVVPVDKCRNDPQTPAFKYFNMSKSLYELNETICYRTTLNFSEAVSPAFIIEDYDWMSGKYSSWTESTWKDLTMRMFLKPSAAHERFTLAIGSITLIMSLLLVYFVKSRSHILFGTAEACSPTSC